MHDFESLHQQLERAHKPQSKRRVVAVGDNAQR